MSDGFKTTLSVLGSVILVLFIAFCIGMCSQGFRNKVYDVMDVVPETEYITIDEYNKAINQELTNQENKLLKMTSDKVALEQQIRDMESTHTADELTIANYQSQVDILNIQIAELNTKITELRNNLLQVSKNINNSTISYKCCTVNVEYPIFDGNDNYLYNAGIGDSQNETWQMMGVDVLNQWNNCYGLFTENASKGLTSIYSQQMHINLNDVYAVTIDGCIYSIHCGSTSYSFSQNSTFETKIVLNGNDVSTDDFVGLIDINANYKMQVSFDYTLNEYNYVTNCVLNLVVNII